MTNFLSLFLFSRIAQGSVLCTAEYDVSSVDSTHSNQNHTATEGVRTEDLALIPVAKPSLRSATHARDGKVSSFLNCLWLSFLSPFATSSSYFCYRNYLYVKLYFDRPCHIHCKTSSRRKTSAAKQIFSNCCLTWRTST